MPTLLRRIDATPVGQVVDDFGCADVLTHLATVPDPRKRRGVRHALSSLLAAAAAAVLAGARSFVAIGEWVADASPQVLAALGIRPHPRTRIYVAPNEATLRRALQAVDADAVDDAIAAWLESRRRLVGQGGPAEAVALDGKTVRGARDRSSSEDRAPHLVSAVSHRDGTVLAQRGVDTKSNEITAAQPLLTGLDLVGKVVTADALHTQRAFADWLVTTKKADYLFIVKGNQPTLYDAVAAALTGTDDEFADRMDATPIGATAEPRPGPSAPPQPMGSTSPTPARCSGCAATGAVSTAYGRVRRSCTGSPASPPAGAGLRSLPPTHASIGRSRTACTTSATSPGVRTQARSEQATHPASWPDSATSP
jgi:hypothetical protein